MNQTAIHSPIQNSQGYDSIYDPRLPGFAPWTETHLFGNRFTVLRTGDDNPAYRLVFICDGGRLEEIGAHLQRDRKAMILRAARYGTRIDQLRGEGFTHCRIGYVTGKDRQGVTLGRRAVFSCTKEGVTGPIVTLDAVEELV